MAETPTTSASVDAQKMQVADKIFGIHTDEKKDKSVMEPILGSSLVNSSPQPSTSSALTNKNKPTVPSVEDKSINELKKPEDYSAQPKQDALADLPTLWYVYKFPCPKSTCLARFSRAASLFKHIREKHCT